MTEAHSMLLYTHSVFTWAGFGPHRCMFLQVHKRIRDKRIQDATEVHMNRTGSNNQ